VYDAPGDILESARKKVQRELGFQLAPEQVALVGICRNCAEKT
jgi:Fur family ferric uptake transcriptional regulator